MRSFISHALVIFSAENKRFNGDINIYLLLSITVSALIEYYTFDILLKDTCSKKGKCMIKYSHQSPLSI